MWGYVIAGVVILGNLIFFFSRRRKIFIPRENMENIMAESAVKVNIIGGMVLKKQLAGLSFTATPPSCEVRLRTSHEGGVTASQS